MVGFDRRTYLKTAVLSAGALAGVGVTTALGRSGSTTTSQSAPGRECPQGTTRVAKYQTDDTDNDDEQEFTLSEGDDVLTFSNIRRNDEGEINAFDWNSSVVVAVIAVKFGPALAQFEGGFEGSVDLSGEQNAISHVTVCAPRGGRAVLCELDMLESYDTETHFDEDPAGGARDGVVHVRSNTATRDYAHGMVNILSQVGERIPLADIGTLNFDVFEGAANAGAAPDEVFVSLLTSNDNLKLAVRHFDDSNSKESWRTFNLLSKLGGGWRVEDISLDDIRTSTRAVNTARDLRDTPDNDDVNLQQQFGTATLAGVGFGAGNTRTTTTIDRYFDGLRVEWGSNAATFEFPAVLPVDVDSTEQQGNSFVVTLSFQQTEQGISFEDVARRSVTLNPFGQFAPPVELGALARSMRVQNGALEASFRADDVDDLGVDQGDQFIVSGDFDVTSGSAFFGVGTR